MFYSPTSSSIHLNFSLSFLKRNIKLKNDDSRFIQFSHEDSSINTTNSPKAFEELLYIGNANFVDVRDLFFKTVQKSCKFSPDLFKKLKILILISQNNDLILPKDLKQKTQIVKCKNTDEIKKYLNQGNKLIAISSRSQWYTTPSYYDDNHNVVIAFENFTE